MAVSDLSLDEIRIHALSEMAHDGDESDSSPDTMSIDEDGRTAIENTTHVDTLAHTVAAYCFDRTSEDHRVCAAEVKDKASNHGGSPHAVAFVLYKLSEAS